MDAVHLRVVQVIPSLWQGGLERVATSLTYALAESPAVERVVVCSSGGEPHTSDVTAHGIPLELIPRPNPQPVALLRAATALARVLRREQPHVVHAHNPGAAAASGLARVLAGTRRTAIVTTFHGVVPSRIGRARRALASSDLVVGVGPSTTAALVDAGLPAERAVTIINAVEPTPARDEADVRREFGADRLPLIVTVGRYFTEKNQRLLLEAVALLDRPVRALVVGYGPTEAELRARAAELELGDAAVITGERHDAADLIAAADVLALSSTREALPLVLLEAMALGTPIVSTDVGGVGDVVTDGETGLLVPPNDAPALAAALERVLDDPDLAARLAAAGKRYTDEHCSVRTMVSDYLSAYTDAIARRTGESPST